jgi:hypothetical protein
MHCASFRTGYLRACHMVRGGADEGIGVLDSFGDYRRITDEVMSVPGVLSIGLMEHVVTDVAICRGKDTKCFTKEELLEAAAAPTVAPEDL